MLFMDHFYNSVVLFHLLKNELGVLAASCRATSTSIKELCKGLTEHGRYEFRCWGGLCAITWKDRKPIHFLSNYHDPRRASSGNRHVGDRLAQCNLLASFHTILHECTASGYSNFAACCRYMGAVDKNDQIARLNR